MRASLVIVSGLPGSGKTTVARRLAEERPGVRLCPDEWLTAFGISQWDSTMRDRVERHQQDLASDLLRCGTTVIIEWGTWAREERDRLREGGQSRGVRTELIVLDPPLETLWQRVVQRGFEDPPMRREDLESYDRLFQRPDEAEGVRYDVFEYRTT